MVHLSVSAGLFRKESPVSALYIQFRVQEFMLNVSLWFCFFIIINFYKVKNKESDRMMSKIKCHLKLIEMCCFVIILYYS